MSASGLEAGAAKPLPEGKLLRLNDWEAPGALVMAALCFAGGVLLWASENGDAMAGLMTMGVGLVFAEVGRSGLIVGQEEITIRGFLRSRRWKWSEVDHFEVKVPLLRGALRVYLADGRVISAPGLDGRSARERHLSKAWISELNRRAGGSQKGL